MKSVLNDYKYPMANPFEWLEFNNKWQRNIDFVFAARLAALVKNLYEDGKINDKKLTISSGYRSNEEQIRCYKQTGGKQINGMWVGGNGYAAKPGSSWHEFHQAIDTNDAWLKALEKDLSTGAQVVLTKFGVFKPLTKGNGRNVLEDWHIQPIETQCITTKRLVIPEMYNILFKGKDGFEVLELQWRLNKLGYKLKADGEFGVITRGAVEDFQEKHDLLVDGKVGKNTWTILYELS